MSDRVMALSLEAPLQAWGVSSRFQRRTTSPYPTRSAITGMFCAAAGAAKGGELEKRLLEEIFPEIRIVVIVLPAKARARASRLRLLEDYHTVLGTRRASGKENADPVVTRRHYLLDSRFGVLMEGPRDSLEMLAQYIQDPVWGIWFGRKCCLPSAPVFRGIHPDREEALRSLGCTGGTKGMTVVEEAERFEDGTDTLPDWPLAFGRPDSSCEGRAFGPRRVRVIPAGSE
jgi:CRISPR system Cascade subunit CasD